MVRTRVGYTGGRTPAPSYHALGDHSEAIQIDFDPAKLSYPRLLEQLFAAHRPVRAPWRRQYRSAIFHAGEAQREAAARALDEAGRRLGTRIFTDLEPLGSFHLAEGYHQKYHLRRHPPLLAAFDEAPEHALLDSTVAARLNGLVAGAGSLALLEAEREGYGLSSEEEAYLRRTIASRSR